MIIGHNGNNNRAIEFPDLAGYKTLVCDLHMHTVFSDGSVWPNIRVMEAQKDGFVLQIWRKYDPKDFAKALTGSDA